MIDPFTKPNPLIGEKPNRGLVIEIKEIIWTEKVMPGDVWYRPELIKEWSETDLGKGNAYSAN